MTAPHPSASPKPIRYFYPASRAHHAYCMAIDFGMKFKKRDGFWTPEGLLTVTGAGGYQIEVAEESLHLLEPQVGDWLYLDGEMYRCRDKEATGVNAGRAVVWYEGEEAWLSPRAKIIQRDGRPFMWPESDAA